MVTRREFLFCTGCLFLHEGLQALPQDVSREGVVDPDRDFPPVEARYYKKIEGGRVECELCANRCRVADLERGSCGVRENRGGTYYTMVHSRICSAHVDPIEKKPLFHFLPGTNAFSLASPGCNMWCRFCQNWQISQFRPEQIDCVRVPPARVHDIARRRRAPVIAYTYTEPVVSTEYVLDTAALGKKTKIRSVMISNGYIEEKPLKDLLKVLDGVKVDLKSFSQSFYSSYTGGKLESVLKALEQVKKSGVWLEIVVLVIPTLNDKPSEIKGMSRWIVRHLGPDVPVHFTRFHPTYRLKNLPSTPVSTLQRCRDIALAEGLAYAYVGNVPGHSGEHTYCGRCNKVVIRRYGFRILEETMKDGRCGHCGKSLPGVWS